ncbi:MAG: DNA-3-methyladenine glycosylase family protein, partial [Actinomycetes bacterium]
IADPVSPGARQSRVRAGAALASRPPGRRRGDARVPAAGSGDPAFRRLQDGTTWRATRTPEGPCLLRLVPRAHAGEIEGTAWGAGAAWALDTLPDLLGEGDDETGFEPRPEHRRLVGAWRLGRGWRVPRSQAVFEALAAAALEQVVTGVEARRAWRLLVTRYGTPAPGADVTAQGPAAGMVVPPAPEVWAAIPTWEWLRAGVEERRRRVVQVAARSASGLERTLGLAPDRVEPVLRSLPGVGVWTAAEVRQRAHGDADAFSWADYHVSRNVSWALTGRVLDDDGCAEVIECYRGHRYRVQRLLELSGVQRPRRGPRMRLPTHTPAATGGRS